MIQLVPRNIAKKAGPGGSVGAGAGKKGEGEKMEQVRIKILEHFWWLENKNYFDRTFIRKFVSSIPDPINEIYENSR